jgi:CRP-like cAMP-binding protein
MNISPQSDLDAVRDSDLLASLEKNVREDILAAAQVRQISNKQAITTEGDRATHLYLVQSGRVRFYHLTKQGNVILLAWLMPGDVMGLVTVLKKPLRYMASTEAASDCKLFAWEHSVLRKIVSRHPLLAENALRISLEYLRHFVDRHTGLVTKTAEQRLAETVLKLGEQCGKVQPDGIEIRTTNDQLGALADISPFTTSRVLSSWVRSGAVSKGRGRILLQVPEALMID